MSYLENLFSLQGKIALVTGASRGLGQGMAEALLKAGATAILVGRDPVRLDEAHRALHDQGLDAVPYPCDLAEPRALGDLVDYTTRTWGRLDILLNNAGVTTGHDLETYPDSAWAHTLHLNLEVPFRLARSFAGLMKAQQSGSIINITSIAAERGGPDNPAYAAAKGGLKQLTKSLAADLAPHGIRVNNIGPGYFRTDMTDYSWKDPQRRAQRTASTLLGRWGAPEDLAGMVILLASDASAYITGQDFYVDGGWLAKL